MKAFIENNNIFITSDDTLVPKGAQSMDVPEGTLPQDVIFKDNILRLKTEAEKEDDRKVQEQEEAKQELAQTDVGMIRIIEDIIDVLDLHDKLPQAAKDKIQNRSLLREKLK